MTFKQNFHFEIVGLTQYIPNDCVTWEVLNKVGKGSYGTVYLVDCTNCSTARSGTRILKHVTFKRDFTREDFLEEVRNQRICAREELCPEVEAVWTSQTDGIMVMVPMHDTVRAMLGRHQGNTAKQFTIIEKCMDLIKHLHTRTFLSHGDTHLSNMMIMNE
jgi:predicted neutral ceramidase superfamily lipid hydrolase